MHPLFRINDGQDEPLKLHSKRVSRDLHARVMDWPAYKPTEHELAVSAFESEKHEYVDGPDLGDGTLHRITEADCQQIKPQIGVDHGCPSGDATVTLKRPCKGANCGTTDGVSHSAECRAEHDAACGAEVWRTEAPPCAGVYIASSLRDSGCRRWWDGSAWHVDASIFSDPDPRKVGVAYGTVGIEWLGLIEADAPRVQRTSDGAWRIGGKLYVCDGAGWIAHQPAADSVCPVPKGVEYEVRLRDGCDYGPDEDGWSWRFQSNSAADLVAWRPVVQS